MLKETLNLYKLMFDVACGTKPYRDLATASEAVGKTAGPNAIPPEDSYLWSWHRKDREPRHARVLERVRAPVRLVYGESDQVVPVHESIASIDAALDKPNASLYCRDRPECSTQPDYSTGAQRSILVVESSSRQL
jgi:pimeloyl-ACP methyl ester carboxylesterase